MFSGVHLTLMIGPAVPVPVPRSVLDALVSAQVTTTAGDKSVFQLTFNVSTRSPLHTIFLLSGGSILPIVRVILIVTFRGTPHVLIDGVITHQQVSPGTEPGNSVLTVSGDDLTAVMNHIDFSGIPYPAMPAEARVALIVAKYAFLGIVPMVIPSILMDVPIPTDRIPRHQGTDLAYVQSLAEEVGYRFYLEPGPAPGMSVAYWGPEIKIGVPQRALNTNMDAHTNVESMSFSFDTESKVLPILMLQMKETKAPIPIPIPDITPLSPPLGAIPPFPKRFEFISGTSPLGVIRAAAIGLAKAARSSDAVTCTGSLNVARYGDVLKARKLVGVRGAGLAFDGLYYVKSVTHSLKRGEYKQNFTLARNGLISTVPQVPA
ncbi:MAG TPA: hypothetical protein VNA69_09810 [Thermoanaerobaculia bacterium]|nr:hypothetical protein [Thermoanaerobaculia bacterium]